VRCGVPRYSEAIAVERLAQFGVKALMDKRVGRESMNGIVEAALAYPVREVLCEATRHARHALAVWSDLG
jgi:hypothetical protein